MKMIGVVLSDIEKITSRLLAGFVANSADMSHLMYSFIPFEMFYGLKIFVMNSLKYVGMLCHWRGNPLKTSVRLSSYKF